VTFERTAGPAVAVEAVEAVTDAEGYVSIPLEPLEGGVIVGTLTVRSAGVPAESTPGLRFRTADDDVAQYGGAFGFGAQLFSVIELNRRHVFAPLSPGLAWTFTPTSGPLTSTITGVTNVSGYAVLRALTGSTGAVTGTLSVRYAPGAPDEVLTGIALRAVTDDSVRRAAVLGVGPSALYGGIVQDVADARPIAGATVEFRRRGGVPLVQELFTTQTNEGGIFRMFPAPLADGEVVGDMTFRLPPPYRDTTFTNIRFPTFRSDETRFGQFFRVRRP
jgi:hypothetical protein